MPALPRDTPVDDAPPRVPGSRTLDGVLGQRLEFRFSLGALLAGVFGFGFAYAALYGMLDSEEVEAVGRWGLLLLLLGGMVWAARESRRRRQWLGSAFVVLGLTLLGLLAGIAHLAADAFIGGSSLYKRSQRVEAALTAYGQDHGAYPATLRELAPRYLASGDLDGFERLIAYTVDAPDGTGASLNIHLDRGFLKVHLNNELPALTLPRAVNLPAPAPPPPAEAPAP
ncbi:MAG: hypothetical protein M5U26_17615 [Planctomycetota bacterium]|nr:hypothetical protein [Planctomycetota bacterium]